MASVNQTRPHCVNQMGKTHSKPLAARHGRGTAWARHAMCESAFRVIKSRLRWVGHVAHIINNRNANWKVRLPQRVGCSWKDNIKTDLNIEWRGMY